jgi:hypothetical protein
MHAVVSPFPIEETTPPVTKIYLVGRDSRASMSATPSRFGIEYMKVEIKAGLERKNFFSVEKVREFEEIR